MKQKTLLAFMLFYAANSATGQQPPEPYPRGVNSPVSEGNGVCMCLWQDRE